MAVTSSYLTYVLDQLAGLGEVVAKRMFGGMGLYYSGAFFGLIDDDIVYLRVDDASRPEFVARGMPAFRPVRSKPELVSVSYY
jgi:DNA transformation protein and related proteins